MVLIDIAAGVGLGLLPFGILSFKRTRRISAFNAVLAESIDMLARALRDHQIDMAAGNTTDGLIPTLDLTVLEDDRHYFPPYEAVPLVRQEALDRWPKLRAAFASLAGKVTAEEMQTMNEAVDGQHRDPAQVVREFRQSHGL